MYHCKERGPNSYQSFDQGMNVRAVERHSIEGGASLQSPNGEAPPPAGPDERSLSPTSLVGVRGLRVCFNWNR